jgi:predicted esterase
MLVSRSQAQAAQPSGRCWVLRATAACGILLAASVVAQGQVLVLKNGTELSGKIAQISDIGGSVVSSSSTGAVNLQLIILVDNGLTRVFVSTHQKHNLLEDVRHVERIELKQPVSNYGPGVGKMGSVLRVGKFNEHGQRTYTMQSEQGPVTLIQGITEINPLWTKLEALRGTPALQWESRIATSSIPRETLSTILKSQAPDGSPDRHLAIVRLLIDSERFDDAERELRDILRDFPELTELDKKLTELRQIKSRQWLKEIKRMQSAGQHRQAWVLLRNFPTENVAGQILAEINELVNQYDREAERGAGLLQDYQRFRDELKDETQRKLATEIETELQHALSLNTIDRLTEFDRLRSDETLSGDQKLSLAISGWILGNGSATENIGVAVSLVDVRRLVLEYLRTEPEDQATRDRILMQLSSYEGSDPERVAKILAHIPPPLIVPELAPPTDEASPAEPPQNLQPALGVADGEQDQKKPTGFLRLTVPGLDQEQSFEYLVALPPEYDPYRRYPTIVTLHAAGGNPELQLDWWAGTYQPAANARLGQATRHGYIVIAPVWSTPGQTTYTYSAREHAAVLYTLQDAMKRFAVDTDRVFLSGISTGGDAAWDIGLSHPDLWAGLLPVVAVANYDKPTSPNYVTRYWQNGQNLPMYFVCGSMDVERTTRNAREWNRYLTQPHFDAMVTEYIGRGHEHFSDDIHNMFAWMNNHRRGPVPREFEAMTMRTWDNFFWWLELDRLPDRVLIAPNEWPARDKNPATTTGKLVSQNYFQVKTTAEQITMWLSPDFVDFGQPVRVSIGGRSVSENVRPDLAVLLEDARTRGDRQRPFWGRWTIELKK